jgi:hypothetical protein
MSLNQVNIQRFPGGTTASITPYVVRATATNTLLISAPCRIAWIRINATVAGTITLTDNVGTTLTNPFGTAINAPLGNTFVPLEPGGRLLKNGLFVVYTTFTGYIEVGIVKN